MNSLYGFHAIFDLAFAKSTPCYCLCFPCMAKLRCLLLSVWVSCPFSKFDIVDTPNPVEMV